MQKHVNLVDLVKSFPTHILLQNLASIQKRTSLIKFAHLAEKSEKGSISNLATKVLPAGRALDPPHRLALRGEAGRAVRPRRGHLQIPEEQRAVLDIHSGLGPLQPASSGQLGSKEYKEDFEKPLFVTSTKIGKLRAKCC